MLSLIEDKRRELSTLCARHRVLRLELFGSAADGRFDPTSSDLDFLVEFLPLTPVEHADSYFDLLENLQDLFARKVDLVELKAVRNPFFLESIGRSRSLLHAAAHPRPALSPSRRAPA